MAAISATKTNEQIKVFFHSLFSRAFILFLLAQRKIGFQSVDKVGSLLGFLNNSTNSRSKTSRLNAIK